MILIEEIKWDDANLAIEKIISISKNNSHFALYNSNSAFYKKQNFDFLAAVGCEEELVLNEDKANNINELRSFYKKKKDWIFGHISYDFKNSLEKLKTANPSGIHFPRLSFFRPSILVIMRDGVLGFYAGEQNFEDNTLYIKNLINDFSNNAESYKSKNTEKIVGFEIYHRINEGEYKDRFDRIKSEIQSGNIYEINFCQEFYAENVVIDPSKIYPLLNAISPNPFSVFYRNKTQYLMGTSPERYFQKKGNRIISQPIKGTAPRGKNKTQDQKNLKHLKNSSKEIAENVMIVDLVRNDLARTAVPMTVKVEELFGVYTFPMVHQMISTVTSILKHEYDIFDVISTTFPMGSMTGAPKISAMKIIEEVESRARGLFSGTIGYITPEEDGDFNVVIRSLQYNTETNYLSFITGGAITILSDWKSEYNECLLKANAIFSLFGK